MKENVKSEGGGKGTGGDRDRSRSDLLKTGGQKGKRTVVGRLLPTKKNPTKLVPTFRECKDKQRARKGGRRGKTGGRKRG